MKSNLVKLKNKIRKKRQRVLDYYRNNFPVWKYRFSQESLNWTNLKNKYQGKRCFILGNGPSLKQQDLTLLKDEITFVSNWFVLHDKYEEINPDYYCICAHEIFGTPTDTYVRWHENVNFDSKLYKSFPFLFSERY